MAGLDIAGDAAFGDGVVLGTELILAQERLSPLDIARRTRAGRMEFRSGPGGKVRLEVGGVLVAEGKIVRRGGRHFLKVGRLLSGKGEVAE